MDLSAVQQGMRRFLDQLEGISPALTHPREGGGLWPWLVAVAAAGLACEIARRQLRRPDQVPARYANWLSGLPLDDFSTD
jgi:hypothetical protein